MLRNFAKRIWQTYFLSGILNVSCEISRGVQTKLEDVRLVDRCLFDDAFGEVYYKSVEPRLNEWKRSAHI